jgi:flagellum-specific peptidoglycan hydrolase FlgJ
VTRVAVPVYERQKSIDPLPGARVQAAGGADAYGSGVGSAINNLAESSMKMLQDFEDTETLEALNNFKRDVSLYHNAPEKGVLNRQGKDAKGLFQEADLWMQNEAEKRIKKMKSPRMMNNFRKMAGQVVLTQGDHNMQFEGAQIRKYRDAEADATIEMAINDAAANWDNDEVVARSLQTGINALTLKIRDQDGAVWESELAKLKSDVSMARLGMMIKTDPVMAQRWYNENKNSILGTYRAKVKEVIKSEVERVEIEDVVERIWGTYGIDEEAGTEAIDDDGSLSFEQRNKANALYQARVVDQNRFTEREEKEWFEATRNEVANAGSMEGAIAAIEYSRADGWERAQLEGVATQLYKPETFHEDIRDWHQAYQEVTDGQIRTAEDLIYRWNGKLSQGSMKTLLKTFYDDDPSGGKGKNYVGDDTAKSLKAVMEELKLPEGSRQRAIFVTLFGNEVAAREAQQKHPLSPFEKLNVIQEMTKMETLKIRERILEDAPETTIRVAGKKIQMPKYFVRMAEQSGFTFNQELEGYYRENKNGVVEKFDPEQIYTLPEMEPSKNAARPAPQQPVTQPTPQEMKPRISGPRRMPGGRVIGERAQTKSTPVASASKTGQEFLEEIKPDIIEVANEINVLPSVLTAQAILESRWGKSRIGNNIFGVKAGRSWTGATKTAKTAAGDATFRDYDSVGDSIQDLGRVLSGSRYTAVRGTSDYAVAAQALQDAGYAGSEKDYASKLISIIEKYKLYEMDDSEEA